MAFLHAGDHAVASYHLAQANIGRFRAPIEYGPTPHAFTFRTPFAAPDRAEGETDRFDARFCEWATPHSPPSPA